MNVLDDAPAAAGSLDHAVDRLARAVARLDAATAGNGAVPAPRANAAPPPADREELARRLDAAVARLRAVLDG